MNSLVLIVDDEKDFRFTLSSFLKIEGYQTLTASTGAEALAILEKELPSVILLDQLLPDLLGIEVLEKIKKLEIPSAVIMMTGNGEIKTAVDAIKLGAVEYLSKPFSNDEIRLVIQKALKTQKLSREAETLRAQIRQKEVQVKVIAESVKMKEVLIQVGKISETDLTVILQGESGTGKEVIARSIHQQSHRSERSFVAVDCGSIPEALVESELFGYEKGAFTGADKKKLGYFEFAEHGTLFLDEIGNIPIALQAKLLRVIQERKIQHLGGQHEIPIDVRIIVATNLPLEKAVEEKKFRKDLYYRLNQFTIWLPPLKERMEDIQSLSGETLQEANKEFNKNIKSISSGAMEYLKKYDWPGNVRELKNVIRIASLMADQEIEAEHLPFEITGERRKERRKDETTEVHPIHEEQTFSHPMDMKKIKNLKIRYHLEKITSEIEKKLLLEALERTQFNKTKASQLLGIDRTALYCKLHQYHLAKRTKTIIR